MSKTTFVRKPCTLDDVRTHAAQIEERHGGEALDSYYVAEEIQLGENVFFELHENLLAERGWCRGSLTVLIIDPQGFDYPRYVGLEQL